MSVEADGIDNDCDGKIDEEQRDRKDNDRDGRIDEDLARVNFAICQLLTLAATWCHMPLFATCFHLPLVSTCHMLTLAICCFILD